MNIIVDTREKQPLTFTRSTQIETKSGTLHTGDYSLEGMEDIFAIERKASTAEVANNITEKRWKDVLERLSAYKYKFFICEFSFKNILEFPRNSGIPSSKQQYIKISPGFLMSAMAKIQVDYGVPVIYAGSRMESEIIIETICKRVIENER